MKRFLDSKYEFLLKTFYGENNYISIVEEVSKNLENVPTVELYDALNLLKACVFSDQTFTDYYDGVKQINNTNDKVILDVCLAYIDKAEPEGIENFFKKMNRRDIVSEVASIKFGVGQENVTQNMRDELLFNPGDVYSITDTQLKNWDEYFFNTARQIARNSKCFSRRIGAVLVKDNSIISTGYNSPPRGVPRCDARWLIDARFIKRYNPDGKIKYEDAKGKCPRKVLGAKSGEMLDICPAGHSEENAILNAAWHGIATKGATMYVTCGIPCHRCITKIINAGVSEIVCTGIKFYDENSEFLLNNSEVKVRLYEF
jgi:dCMP deaminase